MTPITPITKINSLERVSGGIRPEWSGRQIWIKGKVVYSSKLEFAIDDGTGTIYVQGPRPLGMYLLVYGTLREVPLHGVAVPTLLSSEIHLVLVFQDVPRIILVTFLGGSVYIVIHYRKRKRQRRRRSDH